MTWHPDSFSTSRWEKAAAGMAGRRGWLEKPCRTPGCKYTVFVFGPEEQKRCEICTRVLLNELERHIRSKEKRDE